VQHTFKETLFRVATDNGKRFANHETIKEHLTSIFCFYFGNQKNRR